MCALAISYKGSITGTLMPPHVYCSRSFEERFHWLATGCPTGLSNSSFSSRVAATPSNRLLCTTLMIGLPLELDSLNTPQAVHPVPGVPTGPAQGHLHHQHHREPQLPTPEDHQESGSLPDRRRRGQTAVAGHLRHRGQARPRPRSRTRQTRQPAHRPRPAHRRSHHRLATSPRCRSGTSVWLVAMPGLVPIIMVLGRRMTGVEG